ncbi:ROK family transcriptional regulator [Ruminococcaceae bacterium OttesenSCG-928-D13]|nr:ROK family transcriptional regulator [Ruminococcaceae bacterium OttesenSCG-928-D13]
MDFKPTNHEVRIFNRQRVINTLFRQGPMTVQELTTTLGLSHGTITNIIKELSARGLVTRGDTLSSSGGRPPSCVTLVFDARCAIGVSLSTNHMRILQVDLGPQIIRQEKHVLPMDGEAAYWVQVNALLEGFIQRSGIDESTLLGVGLSIQAPMEKGRSIAARMQGEVGYDYWDSETIHQAFKRPVTVNNDAKTASYAQIWGLDQDQDMVYLLLGTGVGGAIIINRRIWEEGRKNAEFGHMTVREGGRLCSCGQHGCLGVYCSSRALRGEAGVELDAFFIQLHSGDAAFERIWEEYLHYLAIGINNIHTIFDTKVIVGGEMSQYLKGYEAEMKSRLDGLNPFGEKADYLRIGEYGEYDSAMGAALLHIDAFLNQ